ncbi:hypothetical protein [Mycoplasma sp. SG1]|uniref:hypothetical protein n=1 Tax=Mycoplasma sp. SG1 TaxID=2810348 RepID=UPI002024CA00|nr:hypothetical protein [Mycoplasma sp. SG1]URM53028.1 hypothetical protein JRW51_01635 [Mycoplasma sp. SG1]
MNKNNWCCNICGIYNKDEQPSDTWFNVWNKTTEIFKNSGVKNNNNLNDFLSDYKLIANQNILKKIRNLCNPGKTATIILSNLDYIKLQEIYKDSLVWDENKLTYRITLFYKDKNIKNLVFKCININTLNSALNYFKNNENNNTLNFIVKDVIKKIEKNSFCKGGDRRVRWKLDKIHSEYGEYEQCNKIALLLLKLFLLSFKETNIWNKHKEKINEVIKIIYQKLENDNYVSDPICPLCLERYSYWDFIRNARSDPLSLVLGHDKPRKNRTDNNHKVDNVFWIHRKCNFIQGDNTITNTLFEIKNILKKHNIKFLNNI